MTVTLMPIPKTCRLGKARVDLRDAQWIRIPTAISTRLRAHIQDFADLASEGTLQPLTLTAGNPQAGSTFLQLVIAPKSMTPQGYRLKISASGILLEGGDEAGLFYGLQTLAQLVEADGSQLQTGTVADAPDFPERGVMLDVSRCKVPTMETLCLLIDRMVELRINHVQLYIEHTFAFSAHETVWADASPFTSEEILELDAYCQDRFVKLVPNLNSFGHVERWLRHPEYKHLAECPDGFTTPWGARNNTGSVLKPNDASIKFLDGLYAEYLPNFTSELFNIGCDETWELGQGWSKAQCEKKGTTRVYMEFLKKIGALAKRHGRTPMFWGDIILHEPKLIKELPKGIIAKVWGYEANHPFKDQCPHFAKAKVPFYVCPGTSSWNSIVGRTSNALANLENAAKNGIKHGAIGYLNTDWGDGGHHQYLPVSYLPFAAGALYSWGYAKNKNVDLCAVVDEVFFEDPAGVMGKLFYELGKVAEIGANAHANSGFFQHAFFFNMKDVPPENSGIPGSTAAQLKKMETRLDALEEQLANARPQGEDADIVKGEFLNAVAMARHGIHRIKAYRNKCKAKDLAALRTELHHIMKMHDELWTARNRPGGLHESTDRVRGGFGALYK